MHLRTVTTSAPSKLCAIQAERRRRGYIALMLFALSTAAVVVSFYFSYR